MLPDKTREEFEGCPSDFPSKKSFQEWKMWTDSIIWMLGTQVLTSKILCHVILKHIIRLILSWGTSEVITISQIPATLPLPPSVSCSVTSFWNHYLSPSYFYPLQPLRAITGRQSLEVIAKKQSQSEVCTFSCFH